MLKLNDPLVINGTALKNCSGAVLAIVSTGLSPEESHSYLNVFASSNDLCRTAEQIVAAIISGFEAQEKRISTERLGGYSGWTRYRSFPSWFERAVQTIALASGEETLRYKSKMLVKTCLRPLFLEGNVLKDDRGETVATLSTKLSDEVSKSYALRFAASVDLLDIIDFISGEELAEIEQAFKTGREFSKHENLPADVPVLGEPNSVIADKLRATRQLGAVVI